ncbi:Predicted nucleic-acid-binding protein, contains PIN domain [Moraxella lacunata]|uniref:Predicted nucleic-acid-binding protein, contains PIN domain n=2 Tax=Moraxella lacunata TaxID=477 RepID=A0A378T820_MORLA|nr:Predicted nucleic-acid-binding protein, contains PIN domain [Moraxella lacunata]
MNYMTAHNRYFMDSNILLYSIGNDDKQPIAEKLSRNPNAVISTQVLNEFCNVVFRKKLMTDDELLSSIRFFKKYFIIIDLNSDFVVDALHIKKRYQYSYWDSLIIATALYVNTPILYSEDMHHNHIIENKLTIINPFYKENP